MEGGRRGKGGVEGGGRGKGGGGRGVQGGGKRGRSSTTDLDRHIKCMFPPLSQFKHYSNKAMLVVH